MLFCAIGNYPNYDALAAWAEAQGETKCLAGSFFVKRTGGQLILSDFQGETVSCLFDDEAFDIFVNKNVPDNRKGKHDVLSAKTEDTYFFLDHGYGETFYILNSTSDLTDLEPLYYAYTVPGLIIVGYCCIDCS